MPLFDTKTIEGQYLIHSLFYFCKNGRKTHNFCPNSIKKRIFDDKNKELSATF